jgi:hypothetical protein
VLYAVCCIGLEIDKCHKATGRLEGREGGEGRDDVCLCMSMFPKRKSLLFGPIPMSNVNVQCK